MSINKCYGSNNGLWLINTVNAGKTQNIYAFLKYISLFHVILKFFLKIL